MGSNQGRRGAGERGRRRRGGEREGSNCLCSAYALVAKLAALVAPFRQKLVRYHGILAPNHPQREAVVSKVRTRRKRRRGERMPWAELLKRVWGTDALRCSKCGGWRTIRASITDGVLARRILEWATAGSRARGAAGG